MESASNPAARLGGPPENHQKGIGTRRVDTFGKVELTEIFPQASADGHVASIESNVDREKKSKLHQLSNVPQQISKPHFPCPQEHADTARKLLLPNDLHAIPRSFIPGQPKTLASSKSRLPHFRFVLIV